MIILLACLLPLANNDSLLRVTCALIYRAHYWAGQSAAVLTFRKEHENDERAAC